MKLRKTRGVFSGKLAGGVRCLRTSREQPRRRMVSEQGTTQRSCGEMTSVESATRALPAKSAPDRSPSRELSQGLAARPASLAAWQLIVKVDCEVKSGSTQGPSWGYLKSQFSRDLVNFWRQMPTKWLQDRTNGSKTAPGIPPQSRAGNLRVY